MDYAQEIQDLIDRIKADPSANKYWKNKVIGRLTELQPFCLMFYDTPDFSDPGAPSAGTVQFDGQNLNTPAITLNEIPESLREFADPTRLAGPQQPQVP